MTEQMSTSKPFYIRVPAAGAEDLGRALADSGIGELVDLVVDDSLAPGATVLDGTVAYEEPDD